MPNPGFPLARERAERVTLTVDQPLWRWRPPLFGRLDLLQDCKSDGRRPWLIAGEIVRIVEATYAARKSGDTGRILDCCCKDGRFKAVGFDAPAVGRAEPAPSIGQQVDALTLLD